MPRSTGAEIVVDYDLGIGLMQQASDQMAADEARSACHEETTQRISSENVVRIKYNIRLVASGQWVVARKNELFTDHQGGRGINRRSWLASGLFVPMRIVT